MPPRFKFLVLLAAAVLLLFLPGAYLLGEKQQHSAHDDPVAVLTDYLRAIYSRNFRLAYRFIAAPDQRLKNERVYVRERGPFTGFTLQVARKLSQLIEFTPAEVRREDDRARVMLAFKAPDMNSLGTLLLDWDEERLNALPLNQQKKILAAIDNLKRNGKLEMIEGQEQFALVREGGNWRMFFDWASGVTVEFAALVPQEGLLEVKPTIKETVTRPNELFTIAYRVKNLTDKDLFTRISHRIEPGALSEHLDLVECALLLPVKIPAGEEQTYSSTYVVRGDIPEGTKRIEVTYEFKIEG
ncbi:MAG: cytochrome c oxidase assembly protein [Candidatus Binatia bacterium]